MYRRLLPAAALLALGGAIILTKLPSAPEDAVQPSDTQLAGAGGPSEMPLPEPAVDLAAEFAEPAVTTADSLGTTRIELRVQRGQTFYEALADHGVSHDDIMAIVKAVKPFRNLRKVRAGDLFRIELDPEARLAALGFDLDIESWTTYRRTPAGFEQEQGSYPVERRVCGVSGVIASSLYQSLVDTGAPLDLAPKMNDVLGWDVDFQRDVREGDTYRILYEEVWKDGAFVRTGPILACEYVNKGKPLDAFRYLRGDGHTGYYAADGKNLQKQLMRAPLNYSRISSGFSYNRKHPVLGRWMPHLGIDYAAPVGTPIWAAGAGTVVEMGRKKGNGRYIRIRHTNREYETYYLHMSRFARGLHQGSQVNQGDVIGYVGATGYATGPHLDFRVKCSGSFVNPRTLKLPPAEPIPGGEEAAFHAEVTALGFTLAELPETSGPQAVAVLSPADPPHWDAERYVTAFIPPAVRAGD